MATKGHVPDKPREGSVPRARDLLRHAGLRATTPRLAVLQELLGAPRPISHAEIAFKLDAQGFDRVTVFRNLQDLARARLLSRVDVGDHTWRFELSRADGPPAKHSHFVCDRCRSVSCLNDVQIEISRRPGASKRPLGKISTVVLMGRCPACSA